MTQLLGETTTRILVLLLLLGIAILAFFTRKILLVPLVAAVFVTYLFDPAIVILQRRGFARGTAFLLLLGLAAVAVIAILAIMPSWLQLESINANGSNFSDGLEKQLSNIESEFSGRLPVLHCGHLSTQISKVATEFGGRVFEDLPSAITTFTVNLLLVPLIAYFMVRD